MATIQEIKTKINNLIADGNLAADTEFDNLTDVFNALKENQGGIEINSTAWNRILNKDYNVLTASNYGIVTTNIDTLNSTLQYDGIVELNAPNLTALPDSCFEQCRRLKTVNMPNVTNLGYRCFYGCINLMHVTLSEELDTMGSYSFYDTRFKEIDLKNVTRINSYTFKNCSSLKTVIGNNVTTIDTYAIDTTTVEYVYLPALTSITGNYAFNYQGAGLCCFLFPGDTVPTVASANFFGSTSPNSSRYPAIYVKDELVDSYKTATNWAKFANYIFPISSYEGEIKTCL